MKRTLLFLIVIMIGCSKKAPIHLIDDFYSYQSFDDVKLIAGNDDIQVMGNRKGLMDVNVNYQHFLEEGKLRFLFYEDKMVAIGFYPKDTVRYIKKIEDKYGTLEIDKPINYHGIYVKKGYDYELGSIGGLYVSWTDLNLDKQYENRVW